MLAFRRKMIVKGEKTSGSAGGEGKDQGVRRQFVADRGKKGGKGVYGSEGRDAVAARFGLQKNLAIRRERGKEQWS